MRDLKWSDPNSFKLPMEMGVGQGKCIRNLWVPPIAKGGAPDPVINLNEVINGLMNEFAWG